MIQAPSLEFMQILTFNSVIKWWAFPLFSFTKHRHTTWCLHALLITLLNTRANMQTGLNSPSACHWQRCAGPACCCWPGGGCSSPESSGSGWPRTNTALRSWKMAKKKQKGRVSEWVTEAATWPSVKSQWFRKQTAGVSVLQHIDSTSSRCTCGVAGEKKAPQKNQCENSTCPKNLRYCNI